jgi:hypothetical protein
VQLVELALYLSRLEQLAEVLLYQLRVENNDDRLSAVLAKQR